MTPKKGIIPKSSPGRYPYLVRKEKEERERESVRKRRGAHKNKGKVSK
jgi:hypothetical protein